MEAIYSLNPHLEHKTGQRDTHSSKVYTVKVWKFRTLVACQTRQTLIRLLLKKQSDQGLACLLYQKAFCEFQPWYQQEFIWERREKSVQNFRTFAVKLWFGYAGSSEGAASHHYFWGWYLCCSHTANIIETLLLNGDKEALRKRPQYIMTNIFVKTSW